MNKHNKIVKIVVLSVPKFVLVAVSIGLSINGVEFRFKIESFK